MPPVYSRDSRRYKWTGLGIAAFFLVIVATNIREDQLFLMVTILLLTPVGWLLARGVTCERSLPSSCSEGERIIVTLTVTNTGWLPKFLVQASDRLPRWVREIKKESPIILQLASGEAGQIIYLLEADKRGAYSVGPTEVTMTDPLGLFTFSQPSAGPSELLVYPVPLPVSHSFLSGASSWGWNDQENALNRGSGVDFHGVREYQSGDELRRVHWRTTARTGKLAVTEFTQGFASDITIALDLNQQAYANSGTGRESALEYAIKIAATLSDALLRQGHDVQFLTPSRPDSPAILPQMSPTGPSQRLQVMETLARAEADSEQSLAELLSSAAPDLPAGTILVYLTPQINDPALVTALGECTARRARLVGFALDPTSFRQATGIISALPALPGIVQNVQRGDNLQLLIEELSYARK